MDLVVLRTFSLPIKLCSLGTCSDLTGVEASYCVASCALGGGEEMPRRQNTEINGSLIFLSSLNE